MRVLFDNGTPKPLSAALAGHEVTRARQVGYHELENGALIETAEAARYDVLVSTDKNLRHQQNLSGRTIALVVLGNQQWPDAQPHVERIVAAVNEATPGSYTEVPIPHRQPRSAR